MSTRSYIGIQHDNIVKFTYCHFDSYPEHMGIWIFSLPLDKLEHVIDSGRDFRYIEDNHELYESTGRSAYIVDVEHFTKYNCSVDYYYLNIDGSWHWRKCSNTVWTPLKRLAQPAKVSTLN